MEERIDELRAKAMASMRSSRNPSPPAPKSKSPASREEGEVSSNDDVEVPACSSVPSDSMAIAHSALESNHSQGINIGNSSGLRAGNVQVQKSVMQNKNKHCNTQGMSSNSRSNQPLGWPGNSPDNLVISFSDDDSGSDSEESKPRKPVARIDNAVRTDKCNIQVLSSQPKTTRTSSRPVKGVLSRTPTNVAKQIPMKQSFISTTLSSVKNTRGGNFQGRPPSGERDSHSHGNICYKRPSASKESDQARDQNVKDSNLETLRHQIAIRENELKVQHKLVLQNKETNSTLSAGQPGPTFLKRDSHIVEVTRPDSRSYGGGPSKEQETKRLKLDTHSSIKLASGGQLQEPLPLSKSNTLPSEMKASSSSVKPRVTMGCIGSGQKNSTPRQVQEPVSQLQDAIRSAPLPTDTLPSHSVYNESIIPPRQTASTTIQMPSRLENDSLKVSSSRGQSGESALPVGSTKLLNKICSEQMTCPADNGAIHQSDMPFPRSSVVEGLWHSNIIRDSGERTLLHDQAASMDEMKKRQLTVSVSEGDMPLNPSTNTFRKCLVQVSENNPINDKTIPPSLLGFSRELKIMEEGSLDLQSLEKMEELHDKELEEAQEYRHRCELEERHALHAYRKAQRALIDANERCSLLYRKRELFSAQLRALLMEASSSMAPSNWQIERGILVDHVRAVPDARFNFLHSLGLGEPGGDQTLHHLASERNLESSDGAPVDQSYQQINRHYLQYDQHRKKLKPDASVKEAKDDGPFSGLPVDAPSLSTDDDERKSPYDNRSAISRSGCVSDLEDYRGRNVDVPHNENNEDFELLEASLRSQLVARLRPRASCKDSDVGIIKSINREEAGVTPENEEPCSFGGQKWEEEQKQKPDCKALHVVYRHTEFILPGCCNEVSACKEMDCGLRISPSDVVESRRSARTREANFWSIPTIDPFWPFCIFELRGKCNNDACSWQHLRNIRLNEVPVPTGSDIQVDSLTYRRCDNAIVPRRIRSDDMSIPTYQIGSNLMKAGFNQSHSILARSTSECWQKGFSTSFPVPFPVQRNLPLNLLFLQAGDGQVADGDDWDRPSFHFQSDEGIATHLTHQSLDSEQSLELALGLLDGKFTKSNWKKALSLLSRAIEADPTSVVLWVVYLHIYYSKETCIGKDDMFFQGVQHNEGSYELWLMYINSRSQLGDRLNAYESSLTAFCHIADTSDEKNFISPCILDIFLQMINFLCICGYMEKAVSRILGLLRDSGDTLLSDIHSCLTLCDRCIFWFCCVYFIIYRKLPQAIVRQFEFQKDLPFETEWPSAQIASEEKDQALAMMKYAVDKVTLDSNDISRQQNEFLGPLHFLAVSHVRCLALLEGLGSVSDLLANYMKIYPRCVELALISARVGNCSEDVCSRGFEDILFSWPREKPGIHCIWNQYAEHALRTQRLDLAETIITRWYEGFWQVKVPENGYVEGREHDIDGPVRLPSDLNSSSQPNSEDDAFGYLNLSLFWMLQKNLSEARVAVHKALRLAAPENFKHFVQEHAAFIASYGSDSSKDIPGGAILHLKGYLGDSRSPFMLEPLSRRYYQNIKKPRIRQLIDRMLGPVSKDFSLTNSILEVCYGSSLLPSQVNEPRVLVDFVESLMDMMPANYPVALSVFKFIARKFSGAGVASNSAMFWAATILVNSICQAIPAAPENAWLEAASLLESFENREIGEWFHKLAVSVYPFSVQLWMSYLNFSRMTGNVDAIVEAARERGVILNPNSE